MKALDRISAVAALAPLALVAAPAQAGAMQDAAIHQSISKGDFAAAENALLPRLRDGENSPEVLLNLAAVYALTDRPEAAQALYRWVLSERDAVMDLSQREGDTKTAHAIAQDGLSRLQVAARR